MPSLPALSSNQVQLRCEDRVWIVSLARADKRNALTVAMYEDLRRVCEAAAASEQPRALLFTAEGGHFCAGNDLGDFLAATPESRAEGRLSPAMEWILALRRLDLPTIAAVRGHATGIGTTALLHMDLVVAAEDARLTTAFIDLGLTPEAGSSQLLPARVGDQVTARLLLAGDTLSGREAQQCGLVAYAVADEELDATALQLAQRLAAKPAAAMAATKALLRPQPEQLRERIEWESRLFAERMFSADTRARFDAFLAR